MFHTNFIQNVNGESQEKYEYFICWKQLDKITATQILTEDIQYAFHFCISGAFKQLK